MTYIPKRGHVVLVWFPVENDALEKRPALVVQNDLLDTGLDQAIFAMITSSLTLKDLPSRVFVEMSSPPGQAMGIRSDSVVALDNLAVMKNYEVEKSIGNCPSSVMERVNEALKYALGLA